MHNEHLTADQLCDLIIKMLNGEDLPHEFLACRVCLGRATTLAQESGYTDVAIRFQNKIYELLSAAGGVT